MLFMLSRFAALLSRSAAQPLNSGCFAQTAALQLRCCWLLRCCCCCVAAASLLLRCCSVAAPLLVQLVRFCCAVVLLMLLLRFCSALFRYCRIRRHQLAAAHQAPPRPGEAKSSVIYGPAGLGVANQRQLTPRSWALVI